MDRAGIKEAIVVVTIDSINIINIEIGLISLGILSKKYTSGGKI